MTNFGSWIIKDSAGILARSITKIINLSLAEGMFPDAFKIALVTPLLKKPSLDRNELSNFSHVCGLNFVSKSIEKNRCQPNKISHA